MCFPDGSLAPRAPFAGTAGDDRPLELTSADGTRLLAHECRAASPTGIGVVVLPDVRGLHAYYRDLTVRLAEAGWDAVALDYFGRTAASEDRSDDFPFMDHVMQTRPETIAADVQAGVEHLRALGAQQVFTLGFCFGGSFSWRQSGDTPGLAGCVGFYGRPERVGERLDHMTAPLLMLQAGADPHIPVPDAEQLAERVPVPARLHVFDGLPHSFFDRTAPQHAAACDQAWLLIRDFVSGSGG
jgi:carboxymethylenebutenolidase